MRRDNLASPDQQASREEVEEEEQTPAARGRKRRIKASVGGAAGEDTEEGFGDVRVRPPASKCSADAAAGCKSLCMLPWVASGSVACWPAQHGAKAKGWSGGRVSWCRTPPLWGTCVNWQSRGHSAAAPCQA